MYGAFKNGGEPRVNRIVPQATDYGKNSEFARNMAESQTVNDSHFKELQEAVNNGAFAYVESSNKALYEVMNINNVYLRLWLRNNSMIN